MSNIDTRAPFFPNSKSSQREIENAKRAQFLRRNSIERANELNTRTARDAKVTIPESIRDFSQIKRAVDMAPPIDNTDKMARLRAEIQGGTYQPDYDAIADRILQDEY